MSALCLDYFPIDWFLRSTYSRSLYTWIFCSTCQPSSQYTNKIYKIIAIIHRQHIFKMYHVEMIILNSVYVQNALVTFILCLILQTLLLILGNFTGKQRRPGGLLPTSVVGCSPSLNISHSLLIEQRQCKLEKIKTKRIEWI